MHSPKRFLLLAICIAAFIGVCGCGDTSDDPGLFLSGTFTLPEADTNSDAPLLVALTNTLDADVLENRPREAVIEYMVADKGGGSFRMDLSDKKIKPGDSAYLIAFIDRNYIGAVPFPDAGDVIGVYVKEGRISPAITLAEGENSGFNIDINREVFDYEATMSGTISGDDTGPVTVVAYTGNIDSSDFTNLDFSGVIGFATFNKTDANSVDYTINILPYGKNVPVENVQVFALLDRNSSGTVDAGDRIGFYSLGDEFSTLLTITDGLALTGIDLEFTFDVLSPGTVKISGDFTLPVEYVDGSPPVYIAVFDGANPAAVFESPFSEIRYFSKVPAEIGCTRFSFDLSESGLTEGDEVIVVGLWDRDFTGGLPNITKGDFIGIHVVEGRISPAITLKEGENSGLHLDINREVFDYMASISGMVLGNDTGPVTLVAYTGDIASSDFSNLDFNKVIGFETIDKSSGHLNYTINILPYGRNVPIDKVQVFALLDKNSSGTVDGGDRIGFYRQGEEFSTLLTITGGAEIVNIDLEFTFDVRHPSETPVSISGDFTLPAEYTENSPPVYIAIFDGSDPAGVLDDPFSAIRYFSRVPPGVDKFSFDLSATGLGPEDEVLIIGLWDRDFAGGLPNFTKSDFIGLYFEEGRIKPAVKLADGQNSGFHIDINREVFDYEASVSGTIRGNDAGAVTLVAYAGEITSSDFKNMDVDQIIGYKTFVKQAAPVSYTLDILPYGKNVPIEKVMIIALLDKNTSGTIDGGDRIGFYSREGEFSSLLTINDGDVLAGIDIEFIFDVGVPSGVAMSISGEFVLPTEYTEESPPVYIAILDGSDPAAVLDDPFAAIRYFSKVPGGSTQFSFDLSDTGMGPDDEVMVIALWDRDFAGGLPNFTKGDFIGIYIKEGRLSPTTALTAGENSGVHVDINREVFDFEASVSGTILGNDPGSVILVAYAGEITSSDFSSLDFNEVAGYKTIDKGAYPLNYTMNILPYGKNVPIREVQMIALLDANDSGTADGGDRIGFYGRGDEISTLLTITDGAGLTGIDIEFFFDVPEASNIPMSIAGTFSVSNDYLGSDAPVYVLVFDSDNPVAILDDPFASLKYFYKMPADDLYFDIDLSSTDLTPGDAVMIAALWDKDYDGGFPDPNKGDRLGLVINKDTYQFTTKLNYGKNIIPGQGYEFEINKKLYDFTANMDYALDLTGVGSFDAETARMMVLAIHVDGVEMAVSVAGEIKLNIDMDYLLAVDILPEITYDYIGIGERTDPKSPRKLPILTALYDQVTVWEKNSPPEPLINGVDHGQDTERTAYLVAVLDKNGNGALDGNDEIGYYGDAVIEVFEDYLSIDLPPWLGDLIIPDWFQGTLQVPVPVKRIVKGRNREQREDGSIGPYWISNFTETF
ncbi:MAG: hypothetical protein WA081_14830 [Desulfosalsimonadaceae bacterium]